MNAKSSIHTAIRHLMGPSFVRYIIIDGNTLVESVPRTFVRCSNNSSDNPAEWKLCAYFPFSCSLAAQRIGGGINPEKIARLPCQVLHTCSVSCHGYNIEPRGIMYISKWNLHMQREKDNQKYVAWLRSSRRARALFLCVYLDARY